MTERKTILVSEAALSALGAFDAGRIAGLREAIDIAEGQDRVGREWVRDSIWDAIISRIPDAIRARLSKLEAE